MPPELTALEHSLWRSETRFDRAVMDATFAADYVEFGRSGRCYSREDLLPGPGETHAIDATLHQRTVSPLPAMLALVTHVTELRGNGSEWANRASIRDRSSGRWQLRFHQGTPCEALS